MPPLSRFYYTTGRVIPYRWYSFQGILGSRLWPDTGLTLRSHRFYSDAGRFQKGQIPPVFKIENVPGTNEVKIIFDSEDPNTDCICGIECTTQSIVFPEEEEAEQSLMFCPQESGYTYGLTLENKRDDAPSEFLFTFEDALGNITTTRVGTIQFVTPQPPLVMERVDEDPGQFFGGDTKDDTVHHIVGVPITSWRVTSLLPYARQYQVEYYVDNSGNRKLLRDWTSFVTHTISRFAQTDNVIWNLHVRDGVTHGYRVRYRIDEDDVSLWSSWATV
jgi:hypothetical protein